MKSPTGGEQFSANDFGESYNENKKVFKQISDVWRSEKMALCKIK